MSAVVAPLAGSAAGAAVAAADAAYVGSAWGISLVVLALYAAALVLRGRRLARLVPPARRRWLTTPDPVAPRPEDSRP